MNFQKRIISISLVFLILLTTILEADEIRNNSRTSLIPIKKEIYSKFDNIKQKITPYKKVVFFKSIITKSSKVEKDGPVNYYIHDCFVYPNPATTLINIKSNSKAKIQNYKICSLTNLVRSHDLIKKISETVVDIQSLDKGAYTIYMEMDDNTIQIQKFIKE